MKNIFLIISGFGLMILIGCSNNSELELPTIDCLLSDLDLQVSNTIDAECATPGSVEVVASGGTTPYAYSLGGGTSQTSGVFAGLSAGSYTINVADGDGCTASINITIAATGDAITVALSTTDSECGNDVGTITTTATGGDGSYSFSLDGGTEQPSGDFTSVSNGSHTVVVTDGAGCTTEEEVIVNSGITWSGDIESLLATNCAVSGCHNGDNGTSRNWTVLTNVQNSASNIKSRTGARSMPPPSSGRSITDEQIALIACWVEDGAQDN